MRKENKVFKKRKISSRLVETVGNSEELSELLWKTEYLTAHIWILE